MINKIKEWIKNILRILFKFSNFVVFLSLLLTAVIIYIIGGKVISAIVVGILSLFMIFNKIENIEYRLRDLETKEEIRGR